MRGGSRKERRLANLTCTQVRVWWCHLHGGHVSRGEPTHFQISQQVPISWGTECAEVRESQNSFQKFLRALSNIFQNILQERLLKYLVGHCKAPFIILYQFYERSPVDSCARIALDKPKRLLLLCV